MRILFEENFVFLQKETFPHWLGILLTLQIDFHFILKTILNRFPI